jgi:hypothetical protein
MLWLSNSRKKICRQANFKTIKRLRILKKNIDNYFHFHLLFIAMNKQHLRYYSLFLVNFT